MTTPKWQGGASTRVTARILERDNYTCAWCGGPADTTDHIVPKSKGGAVWDPSNLVAACRSCNSSRGNRRATPRNVAPRPSRRW